MSEKKICEIAMKLTDKDNIEKDMEEALGLVTQHFKQKYLKRLDTAFNKCRENSVKNPSKELQLIQALKPFLPDENRGRLDDMANMLTVLSTFENIRKEAAAIVEKTEGETVAETGAETAVEDTAIHPDGIYEVDQDCVLRKKGQGMPDVAALMLVMNFMSKAD